MTAKLVVSALDMDAYKKGDVIGIVPMGEDYGGSEVPPNFVRITVTNVDNPEALAYMDTWDVDFEHTLINQNAQGWRYRVEVDPAWISASETGKNEMKAEMQVYVENDEYWEGSQVVSFSTSSMTVDIPKNGVYQTANGLSDVEYLSLLKMGFADVFKTVLNVRRYYFNEATVDNALLQVDGEVSMLKSVALSALVDRLGE